MKANRKIFDRSGRKFFLLTSVTALLFTAGCEWDDLLEDEGDQDVKKGEYRVSVDPARVNLTEQSPTSLPIKLKVECFGQNLPDDCATHTPGWAAGKGDLNAAYADWTIADWGSPNTTVTITISWTNWVRLNPVSSLAYPTVREISFIPYSVPDGLRVTGNTTVEVALYGTPKGSERHEEPANTPRLSPIAPPLMKQGGFYDVGIAYKGNLTDVTVRLGGLDAAKFSTPTGDFSVGGDFGDSMTQVVSFLGPSDSRIYTATLTYTPHNTGNTVKIDLKGQQQ